MPPPQKTALAYVALGHHTGALAVSHARHQSLTGSYPVHDRRGAQRPSDSAWRGGPTRTLEFALELTLIGGL